MLKFNLSGHYLYQKFGKSAVFDPKLSLAERGLLAYLELQKTNPKIKITMSYLYSLADKKTQIKHLIDYGYITEHNIAADNKNHFGWFYEISSFDIRQNAGKVVNHRSNGEVSSYHLTKDSIITALPSDKAFNIPKCLLLDKTLSWEAKGLFILLMSIKRNNNYTKEDIRKELGIARSQFNDAWKMLSDTGFLTMVKKANSNKGFDYDFILNKEPESVKAIITDKFLNVVDNSIIFCPSRDVENVMDCKISDNIRNIINKTNNYKSILYKSSKTGIFEDELKPILNQIKDFYGKPDNTELIDTLNNKLLSLYKNKRIDLFSLVSSYRKVLSKYEMSSYCNILCMSAYVNSIIRNDFQFSPVNKFFNQDQASIDDLFNKSLDKFLPKKSSNSFVSFEYNKRAPEFNYELDDSGLNTEDLVDLTCILNGTANYKWYPDLFDKLEIKNPNIRQIMADFEYRRQELIRKRDDDIKNYLA